MRVKAIGVMRLAGIGKTSGKPYDFAQLLYLRPIEPFGQEKFSVSGFGYEVGKLDLDPESIAQFGRLTFPVEIELQVRQDAGRQGIRSIVSGYSVSAASVKAA